MTNREIIKLFVPPIFMVLAWKIFRKKLVTIESPLPQIEHHSKRMVIIGNGPSLKKSVELYKDDIIANDRIAVNFFASSELYDQLQPNIYVFADPAFFLIPENQRESIETLFQNIYTKTKWSMKIFIPLDAKEAPSLSKLSGNKYISLNFYFNGLQDIGKRKKFEAWDENLIGPPAQNVLNVAIYLSLFWGYKETYLIGADSSFFEDLRVDQETNELYTIDRHFYNNSDVHSDKKFYDQKNRGRSRSDWKLHELIYAHGRMFEYYDELKDYADYKGLKVYNASEYSWINVFERKKLK